MASKSSDLIIVKNLFDEITYDRITSFMENEARYMPFASDEVFVRTWSQNLPFFVKIHNQIAEFASEHFGEKLKPSYSFLSVYKDGGTCPLHIDRPQCYRTVDYLIYQNQQEPWPINISEYLDDDEVEKISIEGYGAPPKEKWPEIIAAHKWESIELRPNDAVLYSGTNSWHYRPTKLNGEAALVFFHFVPEDFDGPLD